jgi:hypothetical protein
MVGSFRLDHEDVEVGLEGELYYDFLAPFQHPPMPELQPEPNKAVVDAGKKTVVPGVLPSDYRPYKLIAFSNVQFLDAEFTESALLQPGTDHTIVGNTPAFAPDFLLKGGISFQRELCFNIALTAVYVSQQFWQDTDIGSPAIPKGKIPAYSVFSLSGEFYLNQYVRLIGGISNLPDAKYYDRVFANGIEPAPRLSGYAGLSLSF